MGDIFSEMIADINFSLVDHVATCSSQQDERLIEDFSRLCDEKKFPLVKQWLIENCPMWFHHAINLTAEQKYQIMAHAMFREAKHEHQLWLLSSGIPRVVEFQGSRYFSISRVVHQKRSYAVIDEILRLAKTDEQIPYELQTTLSEAGIFKYPMAFLASEYTESDERNRVYTLYSELIAGEYADAIKLDTDTMTLRLLGSFKNNDHAKKNLFENYLRYKYDYSNPNLEEHLRVISNRSTLLLYLKHMPKDILSCLMQRDVLLEHCLFIMNWRGYSTTVSSRMLHFRGIYEQRFDHWWVQEQALFLSHDLFLEMLEKHPERTPILRERMENLVTRIKEDCRRATASLSSSAIANIENNSAILDISLDDLKPHLEGSKPAPGKPNRLQEWADEKPGTGLAVNHFSAEEFAEYLERSERTPEFEDEDLEDFPLTMFDDINEEGEADE